MPFLEQVQQNTCRAELPSPQRFAAFVDTGVDKHILDGSVAEFVKKLEFVKPAFKLHMCIWLDVLGESCDLWHIVPFDW